MFLQLEIVSLSDLSVIHAVLAIHTNLVDLKEWLLLYNVQHQSLWFMEMEMSMPQLWSFGHLTFGSCQPIF